MMRWWGQGVATVNMGCYRSVVNGHGQITVMVITHKGLYRQAERQADRQADRLTD